MSQISQHRRRGQSEDLLDARSAPLTVSHHSPGESQSAYGCCCLMASGASEFVRGGGKKKKKKKERWGGEFDEWKENMRVKKKRTKDDSKN